MRLGKLSGLVSITAATALAAPARADVDTDFADQLHGCGIYGPRDYNAWLGKITGNRLAQTWQFLAAAIGQVLPRADAGPDVGCATALMGVHSGCDAKPSRR